MIGAVVICGRVGRSRAKAGSGDASDESGDAVVFSSGTVADVLGGDSEPERPELASSEVPWDGRATPPDRLTTSTTALVIAVARKVRLGLGSQTASLLISSPPRAPRAPPTGSSASSQSKLAPNAKSRVKAATLISAVILQRT